MKWTIVRYTNAIEKCGQRRKMHINETPTAAFVTTNTDSLDRNALGSPQLFIIVRTLLVGNKRSSDFSTIVLDFSRYCFFVRCGLDEQNSNLLTVSPICFCYFPATNRVVMPMINPLLVDLQCVRIVSYGGIICLAVVYCGYATLAFCAPISLLVFAICWQTKCFASPDGGWIAAKQALTSCCFIARIDYWQPANIFRPHAQTQSRLMVRRI